MASSPSSTSSSSTPAAAARKRTEPPLFTKHKIFLSHSGKQKGFAEQLCVDLEGYGYEPFFDKRPESLPKGQRFPELIFEAAKRCLIAVVMLSEDFLQSKWPMLELAAFFKAQKSRKELSVLPVYLNLPLESLKNENRWLQVWQQWVERDKNVNLDEWLAALRGLDRINSILSQNFDSEVSLRQKIVESILEMYPPETMSDVSHVQGQERICQEILKKFESTTVDRHTKAKVIGVYGIEGTGKSTLCMCLRDRLFQEFRGRVCHIELGTDQSIVMLQRKGLRELTGAKEDFLSHITTKEQGHKAMRDRIPTQRVFLALDNVSDRADSLYAAQMILGLQFLEDSMVLVTGRSQGFLQECLGIGQDCCMAVPSLKKCEAKHVVLHQVNLSSHVLSSDLTRDQMAIVDHIVERACFQDHFHPLALKVLAAQLENDPMHWNASDLDLHHATDIDHPIFSLIETTFSRLASQELKDLFLDVALYSPEDCQTVKEICQWLSDTMYSDKSSMQLKKLALLALLKRVNVDQATNSKLISISFGPYLSGVWSSFCSQLQEEFELSSLWSRFHTGFEGRRCYLRIESGASLVAVQRKYLREVMGETEEFLNSCVTTEEEGRHAIWRRKPSRRVFLVLDIRGLFDKVDDHTHEAIRPLVETAQMFLKVMFQHNSMVTVSEDLHPSFLGIHPSRCFFACPKKDYQIIHFRKLRGIGF